MSKLKHVKFLNSVFPNWGDESFYSWKYENPFGKYLFIEELDDNNELLSLRMLMPWQMECNSSLFDCYQPTDSATKVTCRGKGYFTKLTKRAKEALPEGSYMFNFPNEQSVNAYIKLGWRLEAAKQAIILPLYNISINTKNTFINKENILFTNWDQEKLDWRMDNKKAYEKLTVNDKSFVYRTLIIKGVKVADILSSDDGIVLNDISEAFKLFRKKGYLLARYLGLNTKLDFLLSNCFLLKCYIGRKVNFVTFNLPSQCNIRLEMLEADYI